VKEVIEIRMTKINGLENHKEGIEMVEIKNQIQLVLLSK